MQIRTQNNAVTAWWIREYVDTCHKPVRLQDIDTATPYSAIPEAIRRQLRDLPVIDFLRLYFGHPEGFFRDVLDGKQQIYLMRAGTRVFFVDTQGHSYARYIGEITDGTALLLGSEA